MNTAVKDAALHIPVDLSGLFEPLKIGPHTLSNRRHARHAARLVR